MSDLVAAFHEAMPRLLALHSQPSAFHEREMEHAKARAQRWGDPKSREQPPQGPVA